MEEKNLETTEIMETNNDVMEQNNTIDSTENSGMNSGIAMLIGGALALSAVAGFKKLKKALAMRKAKKEEIVESEFYDDEELVEDDTEEI